MNDLQLVGWAGDPIKFRAMFSSLRHLIGWIINAFYSRQDLILENLALRHQLAMCGRRSRVRGGDRLLWVTLSRRWTGWRSALVVLKPDTVVRWHREGWRRYWQWTSRQKRGGRRKIAQEARDLIARIARIARIAAGARSGSVASCSPWDTT